MPVRPNTLETVPPPPPEGVAQVITTQLSDVPAGVAVVPLAVATCPFAGLPCGQITHPLAACESAA